MTFVCGGECVELVKNNKSKFRPAQVHAICVSGDKALSPALGLAPFAGRMASSANQPTDSGGSGALSQWAHKKFEWIRCEMRRV
jgi:hypothetical protein